jgi:Zn-dependent protease
MLLQGTLANIQALLLTSVLLLPIAFICVQLHELAHAVAADLLGDKTPRLGGYLDLDPKKHIDLWGFLAIFLTFGLHIGWGITPPYDRHRLNPRWKGVVFSLAGPVCNLAIGALGGLLLRILPAPLLSSFLGPVLEIIVYFNVVYFCFHMLPIPGLDGYRILDFLFRKQAPHFFYTVDSHQREIWAIAALALLLVPQVTYFFLSYIYTPVAVATTGTLVLIP